MSIEAMKQALDAITNVLAGGDFDNPYADLKQAGAVLKQAIAETEDAVAAEREACAKVCDDINAKYKWPDDVAERVASQWCADAIRARGEK